MLENLITEELLRIKSLIKYRPGTIITEAPASSPKYFSQNRLKIPIENKYKAGFYSVENSLRKTEVDNILNDSILYLKNNPNYKLEVVIEAGESILKNIDNEFGGGKSLKTGELNVLRKKYLEKYVNDKLKENGLNEIKVIPIYLNAQETREPEDWSDYRKWVKETDETKKAQYENHQYYKELKQGYDADQRTKIFFNIVPDLGENQCMWDATIQINYDKELGHKCDLALFDIFANGIKLEKYFIRNGKLETPDRPENHYSKNFKGANLNNGGFGNDNCESIKSMNKSSRALYDDPFLCDAGGFRYNFFRLNDVQLIKNIVNNAKDNKVVISYKCALKSGQDCHYDAFHIIVQDRNNLVTADTWGKGRGSGGGEAAVLDLCLKNTESRREPEKSKDSGKKELTTNVGKTIKYIPNSGAGITTTPQQQFQTLINQKKIEKDDKGNYKVLNNFESGKQKYNAGDTILNPKIQGIT